MNDRTRQMIEHRIREALALAIRADLADPRVELAMVSVTQVKIAPDLSDLHVSVSIMGEPGRAEACWHGLLSARQHLQGVVAKHVRLRTVPRLHLHLDETLKKAAEVLGKISASMREIEAREAGGAAPAGEARSEPAGQQE